MTWGHIFSMVIVVVLVLFSLYFIKVYVVDPSSHISSCESHGGTCQASPCHPVKQWPMSYSCKEKDEQCCIYREGYSKEAEDIIAQGESGTSLKKGHKIFAYTKAENGDPIKVTDEEEELPISDSEYKYYFAAQGEDVGVCYASLMAGKKNDRKVISRVRMDKEVCENMGTNKKPLTFTLNEEAKEKLTDVSIQFIVFPKKWGKTVSEFRAKSSKEGYWLKSDEWVGYFIKPIIIGDPDCDYYDNLASDKKKTACMNNDNCVWCPANNKCLTVVDTGKENTCNEGCYADSGGLHVKYSYYSSYPDEICRPDKGFCKTYLRLEYDFTNADVIKVLCYPKECCGDLLGISFSNSINFDEKKPCSLDLTLQEVNDAKQAIIEKKSQDLRNKYKCNTSADYLLLQVYSINKYDYTSIPKN